jgi:hypothetical protein
MMTRREKFYFMVALVTMGIYGVLMALLVFWAIQPARLPVVVEPLPVLNPDREIAVGETIVLELDVTKTVELEPHTASRFLTCESGNLVTLTANRTTLPVGTYTLISDSVQLPRKITVGDVCVMNFRVAYHINPMRDEVLDLESEPFTVVERGE